MRNEELVSNSWGKHKANQWHDGDFIPDKTYWRQKDFIWNINKYTILIILYKIVILINNSMRKQKQPITDRFLSCSKHSQHEFYQVLRFSGYAVEFSNLIKHCCSCFKHYITYTLKRKLPRTILYFQKLFVDGAYRVFIKL